jgi:transcription elongation factor Elf1
MQAKEHDERDLTCPRCGGDVESSFLDEEKTRIKVMCEDCGRFEMTREDFDQAAAEHAEIHDPEQTH